MPPLRNPRRTQTSKLSCPHPYCPTLFKSQHGRTHHIRVMHLNTHKHTNIIGRHTNEPYHHSADACDDAAQPSNMDSEGAGTLPDNIDNVPGAPGALLPLQRIEHPHLSGLFMIFWAIPSL